MSQLDREVRHCNLLLEAELGSLDGHHPALQWQWANSLITLIPALDADLQPIFDFHCLCGTNIQVHQPDCLGTMARTRFQRWEVAPNLANRWCLCRWVPPPPEDKWKTVFGSLGDYPTNGTYVPIGFDGSGGFQAALLPGKTPSRDQTWKLIHAIRASKTIPQLKAEYLAQLAKEDERAIYAANGDLISRPAHDAPWWETHARVQSALPTFGQIPGEKGHVSFPSTSQNE